jgi:hypothetical protein
LLVFCPPFTLRDPREAPIAIAFMLQFYRNFLGLALASKFFSVCDREGSFSSFQESGKTISDNDGFALIQKKT